VDFQSPLNATGGSYQGSCQGSRFSLSWFGATGETGGNRRAGEHGEVVLSDLSPIAKVAQFQNYQKSSTDLRQVFDPAKLINAYILHKVLFR
jgi:hypothetical protein